MYNILMNVNRDQDILVFFTVNEHIVTHSIKKDGINTKKF
jgi:hypothetical protein